MKDSYIECHITIEPIIAEGFGFTDFAEAVEDHDWKASTFEVDNVDGIEGKWFISHRENYESPSESYQNSREAAIHRSLSEIRHIVAFLKDPYPELQVIRWKIEDTLYDSNLGDTMIF